MTRRSTLRRRRDRVRVSLIAAACALACAAARADEGAAPADAPAPDAAGDNAPLPHAMTVDVGGALSTLSNGYGNWQSLTGRLTYEPAPGNTTYADVALAREFSENGAIFSLGHVQEFASSWIVTGFLTLGGGGDFEPREKVDLSLGRKLLADQQLVATIGVSADRFRDGHSDRALITGLAWYGVPQWVLEGGIRFNWSDPGDVAGRRYYGAATWGTEGRDFVAVRAETGNEAYQVIAPGQALVNFDSQLASATWRHWLKPDRGFSIGTEVYHNPSYRRVTLMGTAFFQF